MSNEIDAQFRDEMLDFKRQMLRFVEMANQKFDGLASDLRSNSFRIDKLDQKVGVVEQKLDRIDLKVGGVETKLDLVVEKVVDHERRLRGIENERPTSPAVN